MYFPRPPHLFSINSAAHFPFCRTIVKKREREKTRIFQSKYTQKFIDVCCFGLFIVAFWAISDKFQQYTRHTAYSHFWLTNGRLAFIAADAKWIVNHESKFKSISFNIYTHTHTRTHWTRTACIYAYNTRHYNTVFMCTCAARAHMGDKVRLYLKFSLWCLLFEMWNLSKSAMRRTKSTKYVTLSFISYLSFSIISLFSWEK